MTRALVLIVALLSVAAQQPKVDESNVPDSEKRMPQGYHCKQPDVTIGKNEKAVHCSCEYSCHVDENGAIVEAESPDCMGYCHVNGRRCTCWPEGDPKKSCEAGPIADTDPILVSPRAANLQMTAAKNLPGHTAERNIRINGRRYRLQFLAGRWRAVTGTGEP